MNTLSYNFMLFVVLGEIDILSDYKQHTATLLS